MWALYHTINGKFDLGVISFATVFITSYYCVNSKYICKDYLIVSCLIVVINYMLALPYSKYRTLTVYYYLAIFTWLLYIYKILNT